MKSGFPISLVFLVICSGCTDYKDYFEGINKTPEIKINNTPQAFDTLKVGFSHSYHLNISDEEPLVAAVSQSGKDSIRQDRGELVILAKAEDDNEITLEAVDSYSKKATAKLYLHTFKNLPPVAKLTVTGSENVVLDASASYDQDSKFGGKIVRYYFTINNYVIDVSKSPINYVFETSGVKLIKLRVQDNEGLWSDEIIINHTIN